MFVCVYSRAGVVCLSVSMYVERVYEKHQEGHLAKVPFSKLTKAMVAISFSFLFCLSLLEDIVKIIYSLSKYMSKRFISVK